MMAGFNSQYPEDFQSPLTGQWPCNRFGPWQALRLSSLSVPSNGAMALQHQYPLTGQWPCNSHPAGISSHPPDLSVPSNGAMALQQEQPLLIACLRVDFQSPLTGQW